MCQRNKVKYLPAVISSINSDQLNIQYKTCSHMNLRLRYQETIYEFISKNEYYQFVTYNT